jgi:hypothetical protein
MSCLPALEKLVERLSFSEINISDVDCKSTCCICPRPSVQLERNRQKKKDQKAQKASNQHNQWDAFSVIKEPPHLKRSHSY